MSDDTISGGNSNTPATENNAPTTTPTPENNAPQTNSEPAPAQSDNTNTEATPTDTTPASTIPVQETVPDIQTQDQAAEVQAATPAPAQMVTLTVTGQMSGKGSVPVGTKLSEAFKSIGLGYDTGYTYRANGKSVGQNTEVTADMEVTSIAQAKRG